MGVVFNRPSKDLVRAREALVAPLVAAGMRQIDIVRRTGISQQWVSAWMKRQRPAVPSQPPKAPNLRGRQAQDRAALELRRLSAMQAYQAGMSQAQIAWQWQVSAPTVLRWVRRFEAGGMAALCRAPRMGRPSRVRSAGKTG